MLEAPAAPLDRHDVVAATSSPRPLRTDSLLAGLEIIPGHRSLQGVELKEMDLDAVLTRKPEIALVDELAHTNAPGSRHEKRWQDIEELLAAGIDVFTTVTSAFREPERRRSQITGIAIRETVPDSLLDRAEEIRLVDIPPEDLLERLREGRSTSRRRPPWQWRVLSAGESHGSAGIVIARGPPPGDRHQMRNTWRPLHRRAWTTTERLLVCVSGSPYSEKLIRTTRRLATN